MIRILKKQPIPIYFMVLGLGLICNFTYAQTNLETATKEELLEGVWKLDFDKSFDLMNSEELTMYDSIRISQKDRMKNSLQNRKVTFSKDGVYLIEVKPGVQMTGTWQLDSNDFLLVSFNDGKEFSQKVISIDSHNLILDIDVGNSTRIISKWHLNKSE